MEDTAIRAIFFKFTGDSKVLVKCFDCAGLVRPRDITSSEVSWENNIHNNTNSKRKKSYLEPMPRSWVFHQLQGTDRPEPDRFWRRLSGDKTICDARCPAQIFRQKKRSDCQRNCGLTPLTIHRNNVFSLKKIAAKRKNNLSLGQAKTNGSRCGEDLNYRRRKNNVTNRKEYYVCVEGRPQK